MSSILDIKERQVLDTPLLLFECELHDGVIERWSTQAVVISGHKYEARVMRHNVFEFRSYSDDGIDGTARVSLVLANADSYFSQVENSVGFKGAKLTVKFAFMDAKKQELSSETQVLFLGTGNAPEEITETTLRVSFNNRLSLQRVTLPETRIEKRCPWLFPTSAEQRREAVSGGTRGRFGLFYRCGYSPELEAGCGNTKDGQAYSSCDYTRGECAERGMFDEDSSGRLTRRFGGIEFVPPSVTVRSYGEKGSHVSPVVENGARYNDYVPLVYGTAWYNPPVAFARNDGNLTRLEVLLGAGEIEGVLRVLANDIEIPAGRPGANMTATGWYYVVSRGERNGAFNGDFTDSKGRALGDPYGSMAVLSIVVPNSISDGKSLPKIQVLLNGLKLDRWDFATGNYLGASFTNNPAWVILDVLRRSGWHTDDVDLPSFAATAAYCDEQVSVDGLAGEGRTISRLRCNLVVQKKRSAAEVVRGIRSGSNLYLTTGPEGTLQLRAEESLSIQQPSKPAGSNARETLNGGWPAYEFGDGSDGVSAILCNSDGSPQIRLWSRSNADSTNRLSIEFQDEFNDYQQDSLSLVDSDDVQRTGQEVASASSALGIPNVYQANRALRLQIDKAVRGNTFVEFSTSVRAFGLKPGDLITVTYRREGWQRKAFRVLKLAPGQNFETVTITAQAHEDSWYWQSYSGATGGAGPSDSRLGRPNPILGTVALPDGSTEFSISELHRDAEDGSANVSLAVSFLRPRAPEASSVAAPMLSLSPEILESGGTLQGGSVYYYAISGLDADGAESVVSFTVRAEVTGEGTTKSVRLQNLRFAAGTSSFCVYRGTDPVRLRRIGAGLPLAQSFVDTGLTASLAIPADRNYDHANFYWRLELLPEYPASSRASSSVGHPDLRLIADEYVGKVVRITAGRGWGQERPIVSNTTDTFAVTPAFDVEPDGTSRFAVVEPAWVPAGTAGQSSIEFEVPNRAGSVIHVMGKSANVLNAECSTELSPVTRWRIEGSGGSQKDAGVPPVPTFGIGLIGKGAVEVAGIGFTDLANTRTITSGTLTIYCWDELLSPSFSSLTAALSVTDEWVRLSAACGVHAGDLLQAGRELAAVKSVQEEGKLLEVVRASHGSNASAHDAGEKIYRLITRTFILPFPKDFFGSRSSGSYSYPIRLENKRIAAAELAVTNSCGDSPIGVQCFTQTVDSGLRALSGGQYSIQVGDWLAIEDDAAPALVVEDVTVIRDVSAILADGPVGGPVELRVTVDGNGYCDLVIPSGANQSNVVSGFDQTPLQRGSKLGVSVISVPQGPDQSPGRDLTVTIRL